MKSAVIGLARLIAINVMSAGYLLAPAGIAKATIAFKEATGLDCSSCHATPGTSMKPLTKFGQDYKANKYQLPAAVQPSVAPTCPPGFVFFEGRCDPVAAAPAITPSCPPGYVFSGGNCVFAGAPGPVPAPSGVSSGNFYAIAGSFPQRAIAESRASQLGYGWRVFNTSQCKNFTPGLWVTAAGPFNQQSEAEAYAGGARTGANIRDAYVKACNP